MARKTEIFDNEGNKVGVTVKQHGCLSFIGWVSAIAMTIGVLDWVIHAIAHLF